MTRAKGWFVPVLLALAVWLAALALGNWRELGARIEYPFLDWALRQAAQAPDPDIVLVPQVSNARRYPQIDLTKFPNIVRIDAALRQIDAFYRAAPEQQPEAKEPQ